MLRWLPRRVACRRILSPASYTRENTYSIGRRDRQVTFLDEDPRRLVVKPDPEVEWIRSPDVVWGWTPADGGDREMLEGYFLRLCRHPGCCIPVCAYVGLGRFGVRCHWEELDFDVSAERSEHGRDDNAVEWRFAASTGGGQGDGGRSEGTIGARTEIEVERGDGVGDPDDLTGKRENGVVAIDMGGEGGTHGGESVWLIGGGSIGQS